MRLCARCAIRILDDAPVCSYHERGCVADVCYCDSSQQVHQRCCERCSPMKPTHSIAGAR